MDPYICVSDPAGLPTTEAAVHHTVFVTSVLWPCRVSVCTTAQPIPHPAWKDPILGMSSMKDPASTKLDCQNQMIQKQVPYR